jgi:Icc-related predicted phosphoesterase
MQLLVIGDLHLGRDQWQPEIPEAWNAYDAILLVGDVVDTGASSFSGISDFYDSIGDLNPPTISIPGNHDYQSHTDTIANIPGIINGHATKIQVAEATIGGLGSTLFDEGPEVRGRLLREHSPSLSLVERIADTTASGISDDVETFDTNALQWYQDRFANLSELQLGTADRPRVLLTHVPAYGTTGAALDSHPRHPGPVSWGSLALRRYIEETPLDLHVCGHIHEQGGQDTIGKTVTVNAGYRQGFSIDLSTSGVGSVDPVAIQPRSDLR